MRTSSNFNQPEHLYPRKIALHAQRLIQGTLFYNVLADTTIGIYFSEVPHAAEKMKEKLIKSGWSEEILTKLVGHALKNISMSSKIQYFSTRSIL